VSLYVLPSSALVVATSGNGYGQVEREASFGAMLVVGWQKGVQLVNS
jgi:hypothetical protein